MVDEVIEAPKGLIAENPVPPTEVPVEVPVPKLSVPVVPLPKEKPVEPLPKRPPVVAAAILILISWRQLHSIDQPIRTLVIKFINCITGLQLYHSTWRPAEVG